MKLNENVMPKKEMEIRKRKCLKKHWAYNTIIKRNVIEQSRAGEDSCACLLLLTKRSYACVLVLTRNPGMFCSVHLLACLLTGTTQHEMKSTSRGGLAQGSSAPRCYRFSIVWEAHRDGKWGWLGWLWKMTKNKWPLLWGSFVVGCWSLLWGLWGSV